MIKVFATDATGRSHVIDVSRGIFVIWMTIAHSLTIAGVASDSYLQYLRPPGWSTTCFIMLTGFSCAFLSHSKNHNFLYLKEKLFDKSLRVFIIAVVSNILFQFVKISCNGKCSVESISNIIFLKNEWTISSILMATAIVLFIVPFLSKFYSFVSPFGILVFVSLFVMSVWVVYEFRLDNNIFYNEFYHGEYFYFPIFIYAIYSIWFFAFVNYVISSNNPNKLFFIFFIFSLLSMTIQADLFFHQVNTFTRIISKIIVCLAVVSFSMNLLPFFLADILSAIGSYALLFFLLHRVVLFFSEYLLGFITNTDLRGGLYISINIILFFLIVVFRRRNCIFDHGLKKIWL